MKVSVTGVEGVLKATPYACPKTTKKEGYALTRADGKVSVKLETKVTGGGKFPTYVYFTWSDGKTYYLPKDVVPADGAAITEVKEAAKVAAPAPAPAPVVAPKVEDKPAGTKAKREAKKPGPVETKKVA